MSMYVPPVRWANLFWAAASFLMLTLLAACSSPPPPGEATVVRVVDGDTIVVRMEGRDYTLRYIGIDTPETVKPNTPVQCFGQEASRRNRELVEGKKVRLEKDVSETDRFGRLLRYVYVDGRMVNAILVEEGYAQVSTFPPDVKYQEEFLRLQRKAREEGRGLWGSCKAGVQAEATTGPFTVEAQVSDATPRRNSTVTVTGRLLREGQGVAGANMRAVWHFKSGESQCQGGASNGEGYASCSRSIGAATAGFTVAIDVIFTYEGQEYMAQTSFTPR